MEKRRTFLKSLALTGIFGGLTGLARAKSREEELLEKIAATRPASGSSVMGLTVPPIAQVKVAVVGLGNRGTFLTQLVDALCPEKATLTAICDVRKEQVEKTLKNLKDSGHGQKPAVYHTDPDGWKEMMRRDDIDLVIIATPWNLHVPMCVYGMQNGKHVATEVPAAYTLEGCWDLVNTAEETQRNCMMLENVCYGDEELWLLNMVADGVFEYLPMQKLPISTI
ncbi:MAG: Gfo/Idh/MocA family oxidoreductase [Bacteroidia bacterium]